MSSTSNAINTSASSTTSSSNSTTTTTTTTTSSAGSSEQDASTASRSNPVPKKNESQVNLPKDKHSVSKRLQQELLSLMMSGEKGVSAFPDGDNLFKWIGTIQGPIGTVRAVCLVLA